MDRFEGPKFHFLSLSCAEEPIAESMRMAEAGLIGRTALTITITTLLLLLLLQSFITPLELYNTVEGLGRVPFPSR